MSPLDRHAGRTYKHPIMENGTSAPILPVAWCTAAHVFIVRRKLPLSAWRDTSARWAVGILVRLCTWRRTPQGTAAMARLFGGGWAVSLNRTNLGAYI